LHQETSSSRRPARHKCGGNHTASRACGVGCTEQTGDNKICDGMHTGAIFGRRNSSVDTTATARAVAVARRRIAVGRHRVTSQSERSARRVGKRTPQSQTFLVSRQKRLTPVGHPSTNWGPSFCDSSRRPNKYRCPIQCGRANAIVLEFKDRSHRLATRTVLNRSVIQAGGSFCDSRSTRSLIQFSASTDQPTRRLRVNRAKNRTQGAQGPPAYREIGR
jgi:hypothetical protein